MRRLEQSHHAVPAAICVSRSKEGSVRARDDSIRRSHEDPTRIPREGIAKGHRESVSRSTMPVLRERAASPRCSCSVVKRKRIVERRRVVSDHRTGPRSQKSGLKGSRSTASPHRSRSFFPFYSRSMINSHGRFVPFCERVLPSPHAIHN